MVARWSAERWHIGGLRPRDGFGREPPRLVTADRQTYQEIGVDSGFGYTYFDPKSGNEFSAVLGFTYNFENQHTDYQNGVDMHLDWGASKILDQAVAGRLGRLRLPADIR